MDSKAMGQNLNAALAKKRMKQKDLAKKLGLTDSNVNAVSYWCNGKRTPNTKQIIEMSNILGVSTDYLLGLTKVSTKDNKLQDICDATGLKDSTINFFKKNKNEGNYHPYFNPKPYGVDAVCFIELLIDAFINNKEICKSFDYIKQATASINEICNEEGNPQGHIKRIEDIQRGINGEKLALIQFFTNVIDDYCVLDIGLTNEELKEKINSINNIIWA